MKALKLQYWSILLLTVLAGCGDNSTTATATSSTKISYAGSTDSATLTQADSATLLGGAFQGGQTGNAVGSAAGLANNVVGPRPPRTLILSQALNKAILQANLSSLDSPDNAAAINPVSAQATGNCGGQMSYTGTEDDASRQFYATFTFDKYCEDATTITGTVTASGQTDSTLGFSSLSLSFDALTVSSIGDSFTANGYQLITPHSGFLDVSMNMLLQDDASKLVYKIEKFALTIIDGAGYVDVSLSGRYYDPKYGFIDISTPTYLRIAGSEYWPSSGSLNAVGNISTASFTVLSNTTYQLDIDTNEDGTTDITTTGLWADL